MDLCQSRSEQPRTLRIQNAAMIDHKTQPNRVFSVPMLTICSFFFFWFWTCATPRANYPSTLNSPRLRAKQNCTRPVTPGPLATPHKNPLQFQAHLGSIRKNLRVRQNQGKLLCTLFTSAYKYYTNIIHIIQSRCEPAVPRLLSHVCGLYHHPST